MNNDQEEGQLESLKCPNYSQQEAAVTITATEEVDEFIDQNIQINSNKQMRQEYLFPWTLKFKDMNQEAKYCQLREDMFRSNMLCVYVVWIFIVLCQAIIIPRCSLLVICLAVSTLLLTGGCILVMAEEFTALPVILRTSSAILVHHRNRRTLFICSVIVLMSIASSIGLFLCPMAPSTSFIVAEIVENQTTVGTVADVSPTAAGLAFKETTTPTYGTEIRFNVLISATIHQNSSNGMPINITLDPQEAAKWQQFPPQNLSSIRTEILHNIYNDTNEGAINTIKMNSTDGQSKNLIAMSPNKSKSYALNSDAEHVIGPGKPMEGDSPQKEMCSHPEYMVYTWVLCLIALATGLKLYYLVKTCMALIMVGCYAILILIIFPDVFARSITEAEYTRMSMPLSAQMNILLIVFLTMVTYHARLVEVTSRLDFIWKEQAEKELSNMKSNRMLNDLLIKVRGWAGCA